MWFTFITARLFHLPQLPTPPHGDAVEVVFRREQPNSTGGTCTHVQASFPGAGFVPFCKIKTTLEIRVPLLVIPSPFQLMSPNFVP